MLKIWDQVLIVPAWQRKRFCNCRIIFIQIYITLHRWLWEVLSLVFQSVLNTLHYCCSNIYEQDSNRLNTPWPNDGNWRCMRRSEDVEQLLYVQFTSCTQGYVRGVEWIISSHPITSSKLTMLIPYKPVKKKNFRWYHSGIIIANFEHIQYEIASKFRF